MSTSFILFLMSMLLVDWAIIYILLLLILIACKVVSYNGDNRKSVLVIPGLIAIILALMVMPYTLDVVSRWMF